MAARKKGWIPFRSPKRMRPTKEYTIYDNVGFSDSVSTWLECGFGPLNQQTYSPRCEKYFPAFKFLALLDSVYDSELRQITSLDTGHSLPNIPGIVTVEGYLPLVRLDGIENKWYIEFYDCLGRMTYKTDPIFSSRPVRMVRDSDGKYIVYCEGGELVKLDEWFDVEWSRFISSFDHTVRMIVDDSDNIYICGIDVVNYDYAILIGHVYAIDGDDGEVMWSLIDSTNPPLNIACFYDLYVVRAYNLERRVWFNGDTRWSEEIPPATRGHADLAIDSDQNIYIVNSFPYIARFDRYGEEDWNYTFDTSYGGFHAYIAIYQDMYVIASTRYRYVKFTLDGDVVFEFDSVFVSDSFWSGYCYILDDGTFAYIRYIKDYGLILDMWYQQENSTRKRTKYIGGMYNAVTPLYLYYVG